MKTKKPKAEKQPEKPSKTFERLAKEAEADIKLCLQHEEYGMAESYRAKASAYRGAESIARSYGV